MSVNVFHFLLTSDNDNDDDYNDHYHTWIIQRECLGILRSIIIIFFFFSRIICARRNLKAHVYPTNFVTSKILTLHTLLVNYSKHDTMTNMSTNSPLVFSLETLVFSSYIFSFIHVNTEGNIIVTYNEG